MIEIRSFSKLYIPFSLIVFFLQAPVFALDAREQNKANLIKRAFQETKSPVQPTKTPARAMPVANAIQQTKAAQTTPAKPPVASTGQILSLKGNVLVDGKPATLGQIINEGSRVETAAGSAVIGVGDDQVVKVSSQSTMRLESAQSQKLGTVLEKGRVEGIVRVDVEPRSAQVSTESGTFIVPQGRFMAEVSLGKNAEAKFAALDSTGTVLLNKSSGGSDGRSLASESISIASGQVVTFQNKSPVSSQPITSSAITMQPSITNAGTSASSPNQSSFQTVSVNTVIPQSNPINRDVLQPVKQPRVTVQFRYE